MDNWELYNFTHSGSTSEDSVKSETISVIWSGTQEEYEALSSYSDSTLYVISG